MLEAAPKQRGSQQEDPVDALRKLVLEYLKKNFKEVHLDAATKIRKEFVEYLGQVQGAKLRNYVDVNGGGKQNICYLLTIVSDILIRRSRDTADERRRLAVLVDD